MDDIQFVLGVGEFSFGGVNVVPRILNLVRVIGLDFFKTVLGAFEFQPGAGDVLFSLVYLELGGGFLDFFEVVLGAFEFQPGAGDILFGLVYLELGRGLLEIFDIFRDFIQLDLVTDYSGFDLGYGGPWRLNEIFKSVPRVLEPDLGVGDVFASSGNVQFRGRHVIFQRVLSIPESHFRLNDTLFEGGDVFTVEDCEDLALGYFVALFDHDIGDYAG